MSLSTEQVKEALVKLSLKDYFFSNMDVMVDFPIPDDIKNSGIDINDYNTVIEAREAAFENFYNRLKYGTILNSNGAPYPRTAVPMEGQNLALPNNMSAIAEDLLAGKGIFFLGAGTDGMVKLSANPDGLNRQQVQINMHNKIPSRLSPDITTIEENADPRIKIDELKNANLAEPMPTGGGWWNKFCKMILGRPSKRWANYENAQRLKNCDAAIENATSEKVLHDELSGEMVQQAYNKGRAKVMKSSDPSLDKGNASIGDITQTIMNNFVFDKDTKKFETKAAYERKHNGPAPVQKVELKENNSVKKEDDGLIRLNNNPAPKQEEVAPKQNAPKQEEVAPKQKQVKDTHKEQREQSIASFLKYANPEIVKNTKERGKIESFAKHPELGSFKYEFWTAVNELKDHATPNVDSNLSVDDIADKLATLYMGGELINCLKNGTFDLENDGNSYDVIVDDVNADEPKIHNAVKEMFLSKGLAQDFLDHPEHLDTSLFGNNGKGFEDFIKASATNMDNIIEKVAEKNKGLNMAEQNELDGPSKSF